MTKSAKRKKDKNADFTKRNLKLGKGKQPASNAVDTSFKARSIALPQQSIVVAVETSAPATKRKLTLDTLLAHLKHYGAGVRREALQGLQELFSEHGALIEQNLSKLVNCCVRLISDEDASVRKALHSFLAWLLPRVPREHIIPHAPTLLLFTASAQTHIFSEIRIDAICVLDLLLELIPEQVVEGLWSDGSSGKHGYHGRKVLDGYLGLLNVGTRFSEYEIKASNSSTDVGSQSITLVTLSAASKARVLKSFSRFLYHAMATFQRDSGDHQREETTPLWYLSGAFSSHEEFASFANLLSLQRSSRSSQSQVRMWSSAGDCDFCGRFPLSDVVENSISTENLMDLDNILTEIDGIAHDENFSDGLKSSSGLLLSLCRTIHPVLVSTFLDAAPSVFSPSQTSPEAELELIHSLMEVARCLYGCLLRDTSIAWDRREAALSGLSTFVSRMSTYFPFGEDQIFVPDMKSENTFQQMNLIYCELFSLQSLDYISESISRQETHRPTAKRRKLSHLPSKKTNTTTRTGAGSENQRERVREFVIQCLNGSTRPGVSATVRPLGRSLTAQTYTALLPTLWWLLNREGDEGDSSDILEAVLQHATKAGSSSGVKQAATEFVGRLVLLQGERSYRGLFRIGGVLSQELQIACRDWLCHLPKVLWELGDRNAAFTELILLFMLRLKQRQSWLNSVETLIALCTRLVPFFTTQHATRGELRGPYAQLDKLPVEAKLSVTLSDPNSTGLRIGPAPMKRLALDVAALLVSTTQNSEQAHYSTPRKKITQRAGWRTGGGGHSAGSGSDPVSAPELSTSMVDAQGALTLRRAVDKAVSGTAEEYWLSVSCL